MIGLVVVSHSSKAAEGIRDIAGQMGGGKARIEVAGGDVDGGIGTDPNAIREAIESADDGDGVVVLVDLGSAVMNAELAFEMTDVDAQIADAPVLEGTLNAAVESTSTKATLDSVISSAEDARDYHKVD
ncbi:dihydroxyacetone kinase, phosphotransfer subunit [Halopelagius inordinatus]|uniref:phosphoenolpyruvate--glycerone phosphotransferase n=1 Tax=Halopelagius inordinatus TaxID=553467 RepID=A0A1I2UHR4_9EURY|nr:dihydroxyacetone kinase phosphoryl donor subunit DhaM [Halopelagius inordinatus]SFG76702.1 dihydroxyacetone kinase, phosphotransfer subunit [Halopelagius inordinatus]